MVAAMATCSGCSLITHKEAKADAQQRWEHVRANIKQRLAEQQYASGRFEEAARTAAEAISLNTELVSSYVLLARTYIELGKTTSAMQILDTAANKGLASPRLHYTRGLVFENQAKFAEALLAYSQAIELEPGNIDFLSAQAECLATTGKTTQALDVLGNGMEPMDDNGTVALLRAHIAGLRGDDVESVRLLRNAHQKNPANPLIREELGRWLTSQGHYAEALIVLEPLISKPIDSEMNGAVRRSAATCYLMRNDPASAYAVLRVYAEDHPADTSAQLLLAKAALGENDMLTAMRAIDLAARHGSDRPEVRLVRAAIRWKRGRLSEAVSDLRSALAANPTDVEAHCLLGEVLAAQSKPDDARSQFRLAQQLEPASAWAGAGLASLTDSADAPTPVPIRRQ